MLIASLRDVIRGQAAEIEKLQSQLKALSAASNEVRVSASATYLLCADRRFLFYSLRRTSALTLQSLSFINT